MNLPFRADELRARFLDGLPGGVGLLLDTLMRASSERGWPLYLVGGSVRDLMLGRPNLDIDVAVEGDAVALLAGLALQAPHRVELSERFGTASITVPEDGTVIDIVTARSETYERPGALPTVQPGNILDDLARRDFTANALALSLDPYARAVLLDPHGGEADLNARLIRVMHDQSFQDDPTRVFRAVRYSQRLGFEIEGHTLELLLEAVQAGSLSTVSVDRAVREMLLVMEEPGALSMLAQLEKLGVLRAVHPRLTWPYDPSIAAIIDGAGWKAGVRRNVMLALLGAAQPNPRDAAALARELGMDAAAARIIRDSARLAAIREPLSRENLRPSELFGMLDGLDIAALEAFSRTGPHGSESAMGRAILLYLDALRFVRPELDGNYLREKGLAPGPDYSAILRDLRLMKLDGQLPGKEDEERYLLSRIESEEVGRKNNGGANTRNRMPGRRPS